MWICGKYSTLTFYTQNLDSGNNNLKTERIRKKYVHDINPPHVCNESIDRSIRNWSKCKYLAIVRTRWYIRSGNIPFLRQIKMYIYNQMHAFVQMLKGKKSKKQIDKKSKRKVYARLINHVFMKKKKTRRTPMKRFEIL